MYFNAFTEKKEGYLYFYYFWVRICTFNYTLNLFSNFIHLCMQVFPLKTRNTDSLRSTILNPDAISSP